MHYQVKGILIIAISTAWMIAFTAIKDFDEEGNRVDMLGLSYPEEVFKLRRRDRMYNNPSYFERFKYLHFWLGFPLWFAGCAIGGQYFVGERW